MRTIQYLLVGLSMFVSMAAFADAKPRHVVFLVHGIMGDKENFGAMAPALARHLNAMDFGQSFELVSFEYDTESEKKSVEIFARELGDSIAKQFGEAGPASDDKISFVAHSQGGLISAYWIVQAFFGVREFHPELAPHVDAYLTLGTPFWGAKLATFVAFFKRISERAGAPGLVPVGSRQIKDMALGSDQVFEFQRFVTGPDTQATYRRIMQQIRPLHIGGTVHGLKFARPFALGRFEYEDDTAVPLPCSRPGLIYMNSNREAGDLSDIFEIDSGARWMVVDGVHVSPFPRSDRFPGLIQIPKKCVQDFNCDHPTFALVGRHLLGEDVPKNEALLKKMTGFLVYLDIHLPEGRRIDPNKIKVEFRKENLPQRFKKRPEVEVRKPAELFSRGDTISEGDPSTVRLYFTGTIVNSYIPPESRPGEAEFADRILDFTLKVPGFPAREVKAKVRATFTTFVDIPFDSQ